MKKTVIIGGVAAGASCAARLRRLDENAQIILLERGEYISYANCGLPYHVGDVIKSRDALLVTKTEVMRNRFHVDVRTKTEVTAINRDRKTVSITNHSDGTTYEESYDTLVIATGSSPLRPGIPGINSKKIMTLWTVPDTDKIRSMIAEQGAKSAVVVGGGFIGLEMAENLHHAGLKVSIAEAMDQVLAPLDPAMAAILHNNIRENGIDLVVTDHHQPGQTLPVAAAVVDPHLPGDRSPCRDLAGVGVALKLCAALEGGDYSAVLGVKQIVRAIDFGYVERLKPEL